MSEIPVIGTVIGDPCGIGPECIVKSLAEGGFGGRQLLIGSTAAIDAAITLTGAPFRTHSITALAEATFEDGVIDVLDSGSLDPADIQMGSANAACGAAVVEWLDTCDALAKSGEIAAAIMGPINSEAIRLSGVREQGTVHPPGTTYVFLVSGPLRIVHLTGHTPLAEVIADYVKTDNILKLIRLTDGSLRRWGIDNPKLGIAGLNPHAFGTEETEQIVPAVERAREEGIDAVGPVSPDTIFRQGIDGMYDCIVALYHDQGHIALKSWGFAGNCAMFFGAPYIYVTIGHGTAFDIAGQGTADHQSIHAAFVTAASLAAGNGFG